MTEPNTEQQSKVFRQLALKQLAKTSITKDAGKLLIDLFEIQSSKKLIVYCRNWLHANPHHHLAPDVLSRWLEENPSREVIGLAAAYLKHREPLLDLFPLIRAVLRAKGTPRLDRLIAERLEKDPQDDIWSRALAPYRARAVLANRLAIRWLKLNEDNPNLLVMGFTFFAEARNVIEAVFKHFCKHGVSREYNERELSPLLEKAKDLNLPILPKIIKFARNWLSDNALHSNAGHVHAGVIYASEARSDIEKAKKWFINHRSERQSFLVLNALLDKQKNAKRKKGSFAVVEAKRLVRSRPLDQSPPALIGALLSIYPDDETIAWAKSVYERTKLDWILIELLKVSTDKVLVQIASVRLPKLTGTSCEHEMLFALLNEASISAKTKKQSRAWIKNHPRHPWAKKIRARLKELQSKT